MAVFFLATAAGAALEAVSGLQDGDPPELTAVSAGGDRNQVAVSLAHGFPLWYEDANGLKLELCLERTVNLVGGGTATPCLIEGGAAFPISFPNNFLSESFYWLAAADAVWQSSIPGLVGQGDMLLEMAQEATFANLGQTPVDGEQLVFARIRVRINVPVNGTYRVTHPFGTFDYVINNAPQTGREINQTQDIGADLALDFLASLNDGPLPDVPPGFVPSVNDGIVNDGGASIGPFLERSPAARIFDVNGNQYLTNPGTELIPFRVPITPGLKGVDYFELTLVTPGNNAPADFQLNPANLGDPQTIRLTQFQVVGKVFDDGSNLMPVAVDDFAATAPGQAVLVDVLANDFDRTAERTAGNTHDLNPQAVALVHPVSGDLVIVQGTDGQQGVPTAEGNRVRRVTDLPTGRARLLFTPRPGFVGSDSFEYVVQDKGGLISEAATVRITVEDLRVERAEYRPRLGKWHLSGTSSDVAANQIDVYGGPRALLSGAALVPPVTGDTGGAVSLRLGQTGIDYQLRLDPLPASEVQEIHIRVGAPDANGPIIFYLYDFLFDPTFTGTFSDRLVPSQLLSRPAQGIVTFADALAAIAAGNTYVSVHTADHPAGEARGQIEQPLIGSAPVDAEGHWSFTGKSPASPGALPSISAESSNGIRVLSVPLRLR
ncbi:CHRD domain-containing protein [Geoalkalibacter sp.]|uniref:CHRD domain-containing protein n=1 Tax=Geoalkalibacter sp. TaxID=3041440 RepID=UPI00272DD26C|nr:CHRD domain-containing protein [Geoalkalibacter sp.]